MPRVRTAKTPKKRKKERGRTRRLGTRRYRVRPIPEELRPFAVDFATILHIPMFHYEYSTQAPKRTLIRNKKLDSTAKSRLLQWALKRGIYEELVKQIKRVDKMTPKERDIFLGQVKKQFWKVPKERRSELFKYFVGSVGFQIPSRILGKVNKILTLWLSEGR